MPRCGAWTPENWPRWADDAPKALLFEIARHLAAQTAGEYESALEDGRADAIVANEWRALYAAGAVPQRPTAAALEEIRDLNRSGDVRVTQ